MQFLWYSSARGKCRVYARAQVSKYGDVTPIICFKTNVNIMVCKQNNHFNVQSYCNVSKRVNSLTSSQIWLDNLTIDCNSSVCF